MRHPRVPADEAIYRSLASLSAPLAPKEPAWEGGGREPPGGGSSGGSNARRFTPAPDAPPRHRSGLPPQTSRPARDGGPAGADRALVPRLHLKGRAEPRGGRRGAGRSVRRRPARATPAWARARAGRGRGAEYLPRPGAPRPGRAAAPRPPGGSGDDGSDDDDDDETYDGLWHRGVLDLGAPALHTARGPILGRTDPLPRSPCETRHHTAAARNPPPMALEGCGSHPGKPRDRSRRGKVRVGAGTRCCHVGSLGTCSSVDSPPTSRHPWVPYCAQQAL